MVKKLPEVVGTGFIYMELCGKLPGFSFAGDVVFYEAGKMRFGCRDGRKPISLKYLGEERVYIVMRGMIAKKRDEFGLRGNVGNVGVYHVCQFTFFGDDMMGGLCASTINVGNSCDIEHIVAFLGRNASYGKRLFISVCQHRKLQSCVGGLKQLRPSKNTANWVLKWRC